MTERQALYEQLKKAVADDPEDIDARISLAAMYMEDNNPAAALPHYDEVLNIDPENAEAFLGLGLAWGHAILENIPPADLWGRDHDEEEMLEKAIDFLERAVELDPEVTQALNALGRLYVVQGQEEEAIEMFRQSLILDQSQHDVLEDLGELTGKPAWQILEKDVYMGELDEE
jgi:Tfp pilus assembly protein PilF